MLKEGELYFNGRSNLDLNLFLENYPSLPIANEEFEEVRVEGRNGSLYINKGTYEDKKITFTFTMLSQRIDIDFERVYEWFTEIQDNRLVFGREDRCYKVKKILFGNLEKEFRSIGEFDVTFLCEPFMQDLDSTNYEITTNNFTFNYEGNAPSEPLIRIYGSGNIQLTINGENMVISNVTDYIEIDSKLLQVRNSDGTSKDNDTQGDFPLFSKGNNTISYVGTITKIVIEFTIKYKY